MEGLTWWCWIIIRIDSRRIGGGFGPDDVGLGFGYKRVVFLFGMK